MLGGNTVMEVNATMIAKLSQLSPERFFIISTLVDELADEKQSKNIDMRIGVAKDLDFPSNFDEIDFGIEELFGFKQ